MKIPFNSSSGHRGNALVITVMMMTVVAGLIAVSATSLDLSLSETYKRSYQQEAVSACNAILDRYEARMVRIGNTDPSQFSDGVNDNFGVSYVGGVEVRWKIEPVRTSDKADDGVTGIEFIQNPRPENIGDVPTIDGNELTNDTKWLFRVAAQATIRSGQSGDEEGDPLAQVQGARYVAVNKIPLFKYVLFYAQRGPKGDLELSHSGNVNIQGNVHSNGAIYMGAASLALNKLATWGPSLPTTIGPKIDPVTGEAHNVRVVGVDGIYRLSKPLMFAAINQFSMTSFPIFGHTTEIPGRSWEPDLIYDIRPSTASIPNLYPGEKIAINKNNVLSATQDGTVINPARILPNSGPIADPGIDGDLTRTINTWPIRGAGSLWNDGRNHLDTIDGDVYVWKKDSLKKFAPQSPDNLPRGFSGHVRSLLNGGNPVALPALMSSRPIEVQELRYDSSDLDKSKQELARPVFLESGEKTTDFPLGLVTEAPGAYLSYAIGSKDIAMQRLADGSGWTMVSAGAAMGNTIPTGLIIRERPVPDTSIWPGTSGQEKAEPGTPRFLPYAYGKHWYPSRFPFRVADVSDNLVRPSGANLQYQSGGNSYWATRWKHRDPYLNNRNWEVPFNHYPPTVTPPPQSIPAMDPDANVVSYALGGTLVVTAANAPGSNRIFSSSAGSDNTSWTPGSVADDVAVDAWKKTWNVDGMGNSRPFSGFNEPGWANYVRMPFYYRDNWKFVHLKGMEEETGNGLTRTVYQDNLNFLNNSGTYKHTTLSPWTLSARSCIASASTIDPQINFTNTNSSITSITPSSVRWEGYLVAPLSGVYTLYAGPTTWAGGAVTTQISSGVRVWVADRPGVKDAAYNPIIDCWRSCAVGDINNWAANALVRYEQLKIHQDISLVKDKKYPIVIDFYNASGTGSLVLSWKKPGDPIPSIIPTSAFVPRKPSYGFEKATFKAVQAEIDLSSVRQGSSPEGLKAGLMLRLGGGMGPVLQGADPYISILYNPTRGVFTQARLERSETVRTTVVKYWVGKSSTPTADFEGNVSVDSRTGAAAGISREASFIEVSRSNVTGPFTSYENQSGRSFNETYNTSWSIPSGAGQWTARPEKKSPLPSVINGNGQTNKIMEDYYVGAWKGTMTGWCQRRRWETKYQSMVIKMHDPLGPLGSDLVNPPLRDTDWNRSRNITFFTTGTYCGGSAGSVAPLVAGILPNSEAQLRDDQWHWNRQSFPLESFGPNNWRRLWRNHYSQTVGGWQAGTVGSYTFTIPTANAATTIWINLSGNKLPKVSYDGTEYVEDGTTARRNLMLNYINLITGQTHYIDARSPGQVANDIWNAFVAPTCVYPADTAVPVPATPADPALPDFSGPRTCSYPRDSTVVFDVNSWITNSAKWFTPAVAQYFPRPSLVNQWLTVAGFHPTTQGFRPDVWGNPPTGSVAPVSSAVALTGLADASGTGFPYREKYIDDNNPIDTTLGNRLWMRVEYDHPTGKAKLKYYNGSSTAPAATDFIQVGSDLSLGQFVTPNASDVDQFLAGVCVQSGDVTKPAKVIFKNMQVETTSGLINASNTWDKGMTPLIAQYMASQYQVFWGDKDITQAFFNYNSGFNQSSPTTTVDDLCANEEWFYQGREFWSQNRRWEITDGTNRIEKDPFGAPPASTFDSTRHRELYAKTTVLRLNLRSIQEFMKNNSLSQSIQKPFTQWGATIPLIGDDVAPMTKIFNGLVYAVRTNRFPWNPSAIDVDPAKRINPWSSHATVALPNYDTGSLPSLESANGRTFGMATDFNISPNPLLNMNPAWDFVDLGNVHTHKLQPYKRQRSGTDPKSEIFEAPAFKPQEFHHGVMISKGDDLYWKHASPGLDEFGTSKISIVSPNAIYVQGDFNTVPHLVKGKTSPEMKLTPCAVIGDSITLLSNNWSPTLFQVDGLIATPTSLNGGGYLTMPNFAPPATSTTYNCALVTNNMPTTKDRVMENQSAAFGDLLFLLENWGGKNLDYLGSLVVLDQWRYTRAFLLDAPKIHGTSPFGYTSEGADPQWLNTFVAAGKGPLNTIVPAVPDWYSAVPQVYYTPSNRTFTFNEDFLTAAGTPPFTPFGITASGVGSWMRVMR